MFTDCHAILPFLGILISACIALFIYSKNRRYDIAKEKLKYLYNPLNALIEKKTRYFDLLKMRDKRRHEIEYYKFFLQLRDVYLEHALYGDIKLYIAFHSLRFTHDGEFHNVDNDNISEEEMIEKIAKFELNHDINERGDSEFERKMNELISVILDKQRELYIEMNFNSFFNKQWKNDA